MMPQLKSLGAPITDNARQPNDLHSEDFACSMYDATAAGQVQPRSPWHLRQPPGVRAA